MQRHLSPVPASAEAAKTNSPKLKQKYPMCSRYLKTIRETGSKKNPETVNKCV